jgi:hypothetical protein
MALSELFSSSFLFTIAFVTVLIAGLFAYTSYRIAAQDHKLNAMLGLVTTMATELQFFRNKLSVISQQSSTEQAEHVDNFIRGGHEDKIDVSDDETEDDVEETEDDASYESHDSDDDSDNDSDNESNVYDSDDIDTDIKILNLSLGNETIVGEDILEGVSDLNGIQENDEIIKTVHLETPIELNDDNEIHLNTFTDGTIHLMDGDDNTLFKTITIDGDETEQEENKTDYKKMYINKLREFAVTNGIIADASKLKKNDIIKLIESGLHL